MSTPVDILNEAHGVWVGIDRGTHTASDLDQVLDPRRWATKGEPTDTEVLAALNSYYVPDGIPAQSLSDWSEGAVRAMRRFLRDLADVEIRTGSPSGGPEPLEGT